MTAYRLQSGTSCTGYQFVNVSSSRRVFSCTTACTIYHPAICPTLCQPVSVNPSRRCLRSAARGDLIVPATKTVCYGPRSFAVAGPATWNSLPASLRDDQQYCLSLHFAVYSRLNFLPEHIRLFFSTLVTVVNCKSGRT